MIKICLDIEGSDLGNKELCQGCLDYLKDNKDVCLVLVGKTAEYENLFAVYKDRVEFVTAEDVVPMEVSPLALLRMQKSSMVMGLKRANQDDCDAFVTCGSSGGFITGAQLIIKKIPHVCRAAFTSPFVTKIKDKQTVILDIGASNENTVEEMACFARLGRNYCRCVLGIENPSVYLLSNGAEEGKGSKIVVDTYKYLKETNFPNFCGNVEARDALDGTHDVIVCQGFDGNILLKSSEGVASMMNDMIKKAFKKNLFTKIGYLLAKKGFDEMKASMDYKKIGGAILLGVNKVCVKSHGNSNAYAFYHAIDLAYRMAKNYVVEDIKKEFENN